jgi:uncharacterized protein YrrD
MFETQIRIGAKVYSRDGENLGTVERLILNDRRLRVKALVVHKPFLGDDRIVEMPLVERVGDKGIVLRINADEAKRLPAFVQAHFVEVTPEAALNALYASITPGAGTFFAAPPVSGRRTMEDFVDDGQLTPIPPDATVTVESNVPDEYDIIGPGTDVFAIDYQKVGTVSEVLVDSDGDIAGFIVEKGFLFKHDVFVPVDWISDIGNDHIHLKVTAAEAEKTSRWASGSRVSPATASGD